MALSAQKFTRGFQEVGSQPHGMLRVKSFWGLILPGAGEAGVGEQAALHRPGLGRTTPQEGQVLSFAGGFCTYIY